MLKQRLLTQKLVHLLRAILTARYLRMDTNAFSDENQSRVKSKATKMRNQVQKRVNGEMWRELCS